LTTPAAGDVDGGADRRPPMARLLAALVVGQTGVHSAMTGLRMAAPLDALEQGASAWRVGLLMGLFAAAAVVLSLAAGRMADRHGYHRPLRLAVGLTVAGLLLAALSTRGSGGWRFALLAAAAVVSGAGANLGLIVVQRTGGRLARSAVERVRVFSWLGIAPSFANVVGPIAAGVLIDRVGFGATYVGLLVLPLASVWAARNVPEQPRPSVTPSARPAWELLRRPGLTRLLAINWLLSTGWDVHTFAVPILGHARGFSATTIGLVLGSFTAAVTGVRIVIPLLADRLRETTVLRTAMLTAAAVFALYPLASVPLAMAACAVALGVVLGAVQPMMMSLLHQVTPDDRHGEALALRSMTINAASSVMPLLYGAAGAAIGAAALFWVVGTAIGVGSTLVRRLDAA
jgi:MFS family permease